MDRGLHLLLLTAIAAASALPVTAAAQSAADPSALPAQQPQVVEPAVERRDVEPAGIDTENFEAGLFVGTISIEDFGSSLLYGGRIAYHFTEDLFAEATIGTAEAGRTSYEDLSGSVDLLTDSQRAVHVLRPRAGLECPAGRGVLRRHARHAERDLLHARRRQHALRR